VSHCNQLTAEFPLYIPLLSGGIVTLMAALDGGRAMSMAAFWLLDIIVACNCLPAEQAADITDLLGQMQAVRRCSNLLCTALAQDPSEVKLHGEAFWTLLPLPASFPS